MGELCRPCQTSGVSSVPKRRVLHGPGRLRFRRRTIIGAIAVVVLVGLYVVVVALYAIGSRPNTAAQGEPATPNEVGLQLRPEVVDAVGNRMQVRFDLASSGPLATDSPLTLAENLSVAVTETDGPRVIEFPADTLTSPVTVRLITDGFVELWPFDSYTVATTIVAAHEVDGELKTLPTNVVSFDQVPGWTISAAKQNLGAIVMVNGKAEAWPSVVLTATRSPSTVAFGVVLLSLLIAMPILVLVVAITVYRGRRKVEASFMSWMGAMLFATIPLRGFLPGSPPIGSWIDFLVVLWVIVGLIAGLAIYVAAWRRWSPAVKLVR